MVNFIKTILKIGITALLVSGMLVAAGIILLKSQTEKTYKNRLEMLTNSRFLTNLPPSYLIELDNEKEVIQWGNNDKNLGSLINEVPLLSDLPVVNKANPLDQPEYKKLSWVQKRKLWKVYGRDFILTRRSDKIAIVLIGLGQDGHSLDSLTEGMYPEVCFSLSPYSQNLSQDIQLSRNYGHEAYLDLPLVADNILVEDSGFFATTEKSSPTITRLKKHDLPVGGVVITNKYSNQNLGKIIKSLNNSGLLIIDATEKQLSLDHRLTGLKVLNSDVVIDEDFYPEEVQKKIELAEHLAAERGQVIITAYAKPSVIWALKKWIETFGQNNLFELVPVSALIEEEF